jgi:predicted O-methyltransferase YrrM
VQQNYILTSNFFSIFSRAGRSNEPIVLGSWFFSNDTLNLPIVHPFESFVLAAITHEKKPATVLEYGTGTGHATYIFAANSPEYSRIHTLDLAVPTDYTRSILKGDQVGSCFLGTPYEKKVQQFYRKGSMDIPDSVLASKGDYDLFFIDADHSYDGVAADTRQAMEMAGPGAFFVWHDFYLIPRLIENDPAMGGVFYFLNELALERKLVLRHISGTHIVVGCDQWKEDIPGQLLKPGDPFFLFNFSIVPLWMHSMSNPP